MNELVTCLHYESLWGDGSLFARTLRPHELYFLHAISPFFFASTNISYSWHRAAGSPRLLLMAYSVWNRLPVAGHYNSHTIALDSRRRMWCLVTILTAVHVDLTQELSYRKQIARQLRMQYVEGIYDNSVTLKARLKITQDHWKRNRRIDNTW